MSSLKRVNWMEGLLIYLFTIVSLHSPVLLKMHQIFLARRALLRWLSFLMPRPPYFLGRQTLSHATRGYLLFLSAPIHRKSLWIFSILSAYFTGMAKRLRAYIGKFWRMDFTSWHFLAWLRMAPFQSASFLLNLSMRPFQKESDGIIPRGSPR